MVVYVTPTDLAERRTLAVNQLSLPLNSEPPPHLITSSWFVYVHFQQLYKAVMVLPIDPHEQAILQALVVLMKRRHLRRRRGEEGVGVPTGAQGPWTSIPSQSQSYTTPPQHRDPRAQRPAGHSPPHSHPSGDRYRSASIEEQGDPLLPY
ncbi:hypothetical protein J6590_080377 [Homalodisca vitripennis]|nr:hypothetical protein J6590_080377 [Homalodisca vitripennis]